jgi:atlastin
MVVATQQTPFNHTAVPVVLLEEVKPSSGKNKNTYKLDNGALAKLLDQDDLRDKKVAVISIAGALRKGKSYMLNFFVNYLDFVSKNGDGDWLNDETILDKFHWRGGSKRDTSGIFLWSKPYILEDEKGNEIVVLLMDTQGTFDHKSNPNDCTTIFALSTLLSSVQIFNVSQQIQKDDLENLRLFTEMARLARDENREQVTHFQKLLFLVRDWPNSSEFAYGYDGGKRYLEKLLQSERKQRDSNLTSSFAALEAFLMPHPGLQIACNNSEKVFRKTARETNFEKYLKYFVPSLFEQGALEAKTVDGEEITCGELMQLFKAYMKIFNDDKLPKVDTILETKAEVMNAVAEGKAEQIRCTDERENGR